MFENRSNNHFKNFAGQSKGFGTGDRNLVWVSGKRYLRRQFGWHQAKSARQVQVTLKWAVCRLNTLFEIFIFCPKIQIWFPEKIIDFFEWKTRENVVVLAFWAVYNFDCTRKIVKKMLGKKLVKMLEFCQNWIFGHFDFSNSVSVMNTVNYTTGFR